MRVGRNISFNFDDRYGEFVKGEVPSGRYSPASDVVRSALPLPEERAARVEALRQALIGGECSGTPIELDVDEFLLQRRRNDDIYGS